jgi:selenocysteine lyase/cysteine desulfurase
MAGMNTLVNPTEAQALGQAQWQAHFEAYARGVIGTDLHIQTPYGLKRVVYADWTASGRAYGPIEDRLREQVAPFIANTHTETSTTGRTMTEAYHQARQIIKAHVGARNEDVLLGVGTGCTGAINKLQRLLGLRLPSNFIGEAQVQRAQRPLVLVTHMEHHSNHTSWLECEVDVEVIPATADGLVDLQALQGRLDAHAGRPLIAAITACSNVTGLATPYSDIAAMMHRAGGLCFVDFACSAPYVEIDMNPADPLRRLDALYFSPHKFLGGPGACGILAFRPELYRAAVPDQPGGGTVAWTNPWHQHRYIDDIETREDGGTPGFLQLMRAAMAIRLKESMGLKAIARREAQIVSQVFEGLQHPRVVVLAPQHRQRLPVFSFYIPGLHYNLVVRLLNDRFGIQARGGCSCAGTYGHYLLDVGPAQSQAITTRIDRGDLSDKPGWVRLSFHPTTSTEDIDFVCQAVRDIATHGHAWACDYQPLLHSNDYTHRNPQTDAPTPTQTVRAWFEGWGGK